MSTPFMLLDLPIPTISMGPLWAQMLNDSFDVIDQHDHSATKGVRVKTNGLDINADLDIQFNNLLNSTSLKFTNTLPSPLTGPASTLRIYTYAGDLYYTNSAGAAVQITSGGTLVSTPGVAQVFTTQNVNSNLVIGPVDAFVELRVDTTAPRTITLPSAGAVAAGRIYKIKDVSGLADVNSITILAAGSDLIDGAASVVIDFPRGTYEFVGNGTNAWDLT